MTWFFICLLLGIFGVLYATYWITEWLMDRYVARVLTRHQLTQKED